MSKAKKIAKNKASSRSLPNNQRPNANTTMKCSLQNLVTWWLSQIAVMPINTNNSQALATVTKTKSHSLTSKSAKTTPAPWSNTVLSSIALKPTGLDHSCDASAMIIIKTSHSQLPTKTFSRIPSLSSLLISIMNLTRLVRIHFLKQTNHFKIMLSYDAKILTFISTTWTDWITSLWKCCKSKNTFKCITSTQSRPKLLSQKPPIDSFFKNSHSFKNTSRTFPIQIKKTYQTQRIHRQEWKEIKISWATNTSVTAAFQFRNRVLSQITLNTNQNESNTAVKLSRG